MTETASHTPVIGAWSTKRRNSILRTAQTGTPFRTPDRRRFGPLGTSWRTPRTRLDGQSSTSTPVSRTARVPEIQEVTQRTELEENNIMELTKKVWRVFRLTPLHNFCEKKSDLQHYSKSLSSHVAAESKRGTFIDTSEPGDATVGMFSGLDVGIEDHKAVLIEIKGKARNKEVEKVISQAVLFCTDLEYNPLKPSLQSHFTYFSNMLVRGPETLSQTVQNWMEVQFDCKVVLQTFTSHELSFMAAMFTGFNEVHKPCELVYGIPTEVEGLSNIDYSTKAEDCLRLWNKIHMSESDSFTSEEAQMFMSGLEGHFYDIFHVKLNAMPLLTIGTSVAFVGRDGKLKIYSRTPENVLKVCRHLTDLALDQLKTF
ncbi:centromere protein L-like [Ruditapes philippinarum]|uniref:centromere protein L-like n=1 Tax=Ruditapes philippinarum TaxID=129788 RepID=UPI00295A68CF|nr:centromere protein L-like [Ruditapes philippinarum]XP_060594318.1 centromere protein L-like [Ruditapes philippinarum]